ncbi:MAG: PaaI family thioesterase, partial [bacterium]
KIKEKIVLFLQHGIHFLAPGKQGVTLEATAKVTHRSNRTGLIEFEVRNQEGVLIATAQQVIYFKKENLAKR